MTKYNYDLSGIYEQEYKLTFKNQIFNQIKGEMP